jgi:hypothetical protein
MADAPARDENKTLATSLPDRAAKYKAEIERVVREVGEHPLCELKRSCSLSLLKERIEFVKDIQSIATSRIDTEKFLVIGADDNSRSFHTVHNLDEFDDAKVRQLLDKYLDPAPEFEMFQLTSSEGHVFLLFVIPRQRKRRILARSTVEDSSEGKTKLLLREGDLWTKGSSTGKRLAKPEDWDDIYEEAVEMEAEKRARQRTAYSLDLAIAREKVRVSSGTSAIPSFFEDDEFQALLEELCANYNAAKFSLLLERLRDDLIEAWEHIRANEYSPDEFRERVKEHIKNVFRPNMHWLTLAGLYVVKNSGPIDYLEAVVDLLREIFETSERLTILRQFVPLANTVTSSDDHVSHTVPAFEALVSMHILGAFVHKRKRFQYLKTILHPVVHSLFSTNDREPTNLMAFWPLGDAQGEPDEIRFRAGRINFCVGKITADSAYLKLFGSAKVATATMCQYEFGLELNSFLGIENEESIAYAKKVYPNIWFRFWPSFIAFNLEHIYELAAMIFAEIKKGKAEVLNQILIDAGFANILTSDTGEQAYLSFLVSLHKEQSGLFFQLQRFPPIVYWPDEIAAAMKRTKAADLAKRQ